jgi:DNA polymerase III delta prime subunit
MDALLNKNTNLYQTGLLYNPQLQSAEMAEKLFIVRKKQFELLLNKILQEKENSIPQHYLIIGQRGMGKTTLLKRMEVELHKEQYRQRFIPLLYREEQYNVKGLAEFWLNTLDALADSLQSEKYPPGMIADIDKTIRELSGKSSKIILEEAHKYLMDICKNLRRRPVLLIDNIGLIFGRLDNDKKNKTEQWSLRKLLSENGAPVVVGGGVALTDDVNNYSMPFYDFFQIQQLNKLSYEEFTKLLINLATVTNSDKAIFASIQKNSSRQKSLLELTGGSPRLTVMLFGQIAKGFSSNIHDDLEILADAITPLYKARFEELPTQQQIILDAIALNWDAIPLNKLSKAVRMQNNQLSPQLKRLVDDGWLETTPAYKAKGNAYFISERFFNIFYLIRNSPRRHKDKIYCLSKFLEYFYGKEEIEKISDTVSKQDIHSANWNENLRKEFDINDATFFVAEGKEMYAKEDVNNNENKSHVSIFYLNKALFELYKRNEGLAEEHLLQAFEVLEREDKLSSTANEYFWITSGSVIVNLGYGAWLLAILKEKGYDIVLSPYYTAIQALEIETHDGKNGKENAEIYLKNIAIEISTPARIIIDKMRKYMF